MGRKIKNIYALYKGDKFITIGTVKELAEYRGVEERTIRFQSSDAYKRRVDIDKAYLVFLIEDDEV